MVFRLLAGVRFVFCIGFVLAFALSSSRVAVGAERIAETAPAETGATPNLAATQEAIEMRYRRFEGTLLQLSEYLRKTDPARAELLIRASGKSKEGRIPDQLQNLTELLKKDQLGDAVERQELVVAELQSLLELLMSEARKDDLEREKKRIQDLIRDVNMLISKETDARANTERGGNNSELQKQQKQVADSTKKLVDKIESQDAAKKSKKNDQGAESPDHLGDAGKKDSQPGENDQDEKDDSSSEEGDKPPSTEQDGKPTKPEGKSDADKKSGKPETQPGDKKNSNPGDPQQEQEGDPKQEDSQQKPGDDSKPGEGKSEKPQKGKSPSGKPQSGKPQSGKPQSGRPQSGKPKEGKPPEGKPQESDQSQESQDQQEQQEESPQQDDGSPKKSAKTPGREELQRAKQEMDRAIEELKKYNKKNASDKQDKAIAELMKAKEKLEEILRQLREEERELVLAQLEARFRDMLLKQEAVNNATLAIHAVPIDNRTDRHRNRSVEIARNEDEISLLAAKALTLLKEEGSSVAFPEAVEQIREDMLTVARRLEQVDVSEITQNIEQDIAEGLKEIIEALQKELEKMKDKKQQQKQEQQQEQQQQHQGLVNKLAELKMLRSLQYRVNRRTKQLGRLVEGEQAVDGDVVSQLKQLSDRQKKVQKATNDLATGKNQ